MSKIKVSVIVPVYNVEKYLAKCLDSLVNQTLKEIEIIVVNDGSPDESQKIIDTYAKKYPQVKAYQKKNSGVSDARNYGLAKAHGDYIAFIDGDDFVTEDMYQKMYDKAIFGNFDMVVCDLNYVYEDGRAPMRISSKIKKDTTNINKVMLSVYPVVWNKIFNHKLFSDNIKFKSGVLFEDVEFIYRILPFIKTIGVVSEPFNQYLQRAGSITKSIDSRIYNYIDNWNGLIEYYKQNDLYQKYYHELEYCYVRYILATFVKQSANFSKEEYLKAVDVALKNVHDHFPKYRSNKYFYQSLLGIYLVCFNRHLAKLIYKKYHIQNKI